LNFWYVFCISIGPDLTTVGPTTCWTLKPWATGPEISTLTPTWGIGAGAAKAWEAQTAAAAMVEMRCIFVIREREK